ncbi:MAG: hypothetical protein P8Z36_17930 [Gemmatimonadota bacterium]
MIGQHLTADPRPITQLRPAVPDEVAGVLQRALAKNRADRFNPVAQFADALGQQVRVGSAQPPRRPRRWLVPAFAGSAIVAVAAIGALFLRGRPTRLVLGATMQVTLDPGLEIAAGLPLRAEREPRHLHLGVGGAWRGCRVHFAVQAPGV